jgi:hypothetical protein
MSGIFILVKIMWLLKLRNVRTFTVVILGWLWHHFFNKKKNTACNRFSLYSSFLICQVSTEWPRRTIVNAITFLFKLLFDQNLIVINLKFNYNFKSYIIFGGIKILRIWVILHTHHYFIRLTYQIFVINNVILYTHLSHWIT